jgi:hypothetical protein
MHLCWGAGVLWPSTSRGRTAGQFVTVFDRLLSSLAGLTWQKCAFYDDAFIPQAGLIHGEILGPQL